MSLAWVKVFAPATVANVASGFDVLGFALEQPGDTVRLDLEGALDAIPVKIGVETASALDLVNPTLREEVRLVLEAAGLIVRE